MRRNDKRRALLIFNNEESNIAEVHSSKSGIYGKGIPILPKAAYENYHFCQGAYYVICDTGKTADLRYEEDIEG